MGRHKKDTGEDFKVQEELKEKKSLSALCDPFRNDDMFSEENLFTEMVSEAMGGGGGGEDVPNLCTFGFADSQWFVHQMWAPWAYQ